MNSKPDKLIPALYGGVIMAIISAAPFLNLVNCLCCAGILFGGVMAVFFYKNNFTPDTPPFTSGDCVAVGALAGVFAAVMTTVLDVFFFALFGDVLSRFLAEFLRNSNLNLPEGTLEQLEGSLNATMGVLFIVTHFFRNLVLQTLFGLLGGLIGFSIFKPKTSVMPPPPMPQPPPAPVG